MFYNKVTFSAITYIGVGSWDLLAAKKLGINFLGIAKGNLTKLLKELGSNNRVEQYY